MTSAAPVRIIFSEKPKSEKPLNSVVSVTKYPKKPLAATFLVGSNACELQELIVVGR